jgi:hypothetical protein
VVSALWQNNRWLISVPPRPLTASHLALVDRRPDREIDLDAAAALVDAYRRCRAALWQVAGSRGFRVSFPIGWKPDQRGIGEPEPIAGAGRVVHVFGRGPGDGISPTMAMAVPRDERGPYIVDSARRDALVAALDAPAKINIATPSTDECDGCWPEVLTKQERWRADGVRVIRPRGVLIDAQVIMLPLRHVVSLGDLEPTEIVSIGARLIEVRGQFQQACGVTGLSCFANDGSAARQETPHVHIHVFGRSRDERVNPFELLGRRLSRSVDDAGSGGDDR